MSIHKSLKIKSQLARARNVWTRLERIEKLEEDGRFETEGSVFGLPKVRTRIKVKSAKAAKAAAGTGTDEASTDAASTEGA